MPGDTTRHDEDRAREYLLRIREGTMTLDEVVDEVRWEASSRGLPHLVPEPEWVIRWLNDARMRMELEDTP
jgi:hypothetical protein